MHSIPKLYRYNRYVSAHTAYPYISQNGENMLL